MKKILRILPILILLPAYAWVAGNQYGVDCFFSNESAQSQEIEVPVAISAALHYPSHGAVSSVKVNAPVYRASYKNSSGEFSLLVKAVDRLYSGSFLQYHFFDKYLFIRLNRPALIFPFHYFW